MPLSVAPKRRFQLILIKPSHYDDDGYLIRWWRSMTPSNSLAAVYGCAIDSAERRVLGPAVDFDIDPVDETNTRGNVPGIVGGLPRHYEFGLGALVGALPHICPGAL